MADYSGFIDLAYHLLTENGCPMLFVKRKETGTIDALTGKRKATEEIIKFTGLITNSRSDDAGKGTFQKSGMVILAAGNMIQQPDITDLICFDGHEYGISEIMQIAPAGQAILYKFSVSDKGAYSNA